VLYSVSFGK